jgi:hypothetical protein
MDEDKKIDEGGKATHGGFDLRGLIREAISEFVSLERSKAEPAYKAELAEERKRRESLEATVRQLIEENQRNRALAEEMERSNLIRSELQRLGVMKVDLAYKAVKDEIRRAEDGRLVAATEEGEVGMKEYLRRFVHENPELLPARVAGGSGAAPTGKSGTAAPVDIDKIKPGMPAEDLARVREEIARVASQALRGL